MKIDIVIKDVSVEVAQQIFALIGGDTKIEQVTEPETETIKTDAHLPFACEWCGRKFKSQNSVNSHLKYCEDKPANKTEVAPEKVAPVNAETKKKPRMIATPKPKSKEVSKPLFVAPSNDELTKLVATRVLANGNNITATANLVHEIASGLKQKYGESSKLTSYMTTLEAEVTKRLIKLESALGAGQCMGMSLPDGYQIAIFADPGSLSLQKLLTAL